MKLHRIAGANLASLAAPFVLDLDTGPLARGLFAIVGPTGAGKSTLLDALCLALYDRTPRLGRGGGVLIGEEGLAATDPRSVVRRGADVAYAEVEFTGTDEARWIARWSVRRRPRARDLGEAEVTLRRADGTAHDTGKKTQTLAAIEKLVGLEYESFTRSVLLAQGEFARLLHAKAGERAQALEWITDSGLYAELSEAAHRRAAEAQKALGELDAALAATAPRSPEEHAALEHQARAARTEADAAASELAAAQTAHSWATAAEGRREAVEKARRAFEAAREHRAALQPQADALVAHRRALGLGALLAEADRASAALTDHVQQLRTYDEAAAAALTAVPDATKATARAEAHLAEVEAAVGALAPRVAEARTLDGQLVEAVATLGAAARAAEGAVGEVAKTKGEVTKLQKALDAATQSARHAAEWLHAHPEAARLAPVWAPVRERLHAWAAFVAEVPQVEAAVRDANLAVEGCRQVLREHDARCAERREVHVAAALAFAPHKAGAAAREARQAALSAATTTLSAARERHTGGTHLAERARAAAAARAEALGLEQASRTQQGAAAALVVERTGALHALTPRREEAEHALRTLDAALSLAEHRAALRDGEPCALCGATAHPYAVGGVVQGLHDEAAARAVQLRLDEGAAARTLAEAQAEVRAQAKTADEQARAAERSRLELAALAERWLAAGWAGAPEAAGAVEQLDRAAGELAGAQEVLTAGQERLKLDHEAARVAGEAAERAEAGWRAAVEQVDASQRKLDEAERDHTRAVAALEQLSSRRLDAETTLDADLGPGRPAWRVELVDAARRHLLDSDVVAAGRHLEERAGADTALRGLALQLAAAQAQAGAAEGACRDRQQAHDEAEKRLETLRTERAQVLDGDASEVEARQAAQLREAAAALQVAKQKADTAVRALRDAEARREAERARRPALDARVAATGAALDDALRAARLDEERVRAELARPEGWAAEVEDGVVAADHTAALAQGGLDGAQSSLDELLARAPEGGEAPAAEREAHVVRATERQAAGQRELGRIAADLDRDAQKRAAHADLVVAQQPTREAAAVWVRLGGVIGHSKGDKLRKFAQALTLGRLVDEANLLLDELVPRYQLERAPGDPLELLVVDRERGAEHRSVATLSGGETFLLSLALALGLSGVAARRQPLGCLFIDEGFGALDAHAFDHAWAVLESIRNQGRTIGVISHVQVLSEKIGARVEVVRVGPGQSEVRVVET